jgi:hypothetical protein
MAQVNFRILAVPDHVVALEQVTTCLFLHSVHSSSCCWDKGIWTTSPLPPWVSIGPTFPKTIENHSIAAGITQMMLCWDILHSFLISKYVKSSCGSTIPTYITLFCVPLMTCPCNWDRGYHAPRVYSLTGGTDRATSIYTEGPSSSRWVTSWCSGCRALLGRVTRCHVATLVELHLGCNSTRRLYHAHSF